MNHGERPSFQEIGQGFWPLTRKHRRGGNLTGASAQGPSILGFVFRQAITPMGRDHLDADFSQRIVKGVAVVGLVTGEASEVYLRMNASPFKSNKGCSEEK
jgi:hypothetical protein